MRHLTKLFFYPVILLLVLSMSIAQVNEPTRILVNSQDWQDVYSVMLYGSLQKINTNFLVSDKHASIITGQIPITEPLWVFSSSKNPFVLGYQNFLSGRGYEVQEFKPGNINLDMAERADVEDYVIVDDSYGYNAIAVAPYAASTRSFVLFADQRNIDDIVSFLEEQDAQKILIYGLVDREVRDALAPYNPEIINKGGDRFANNIEILKKYQDINHAKQAILTNGEFIEREIMSGTEPVVFIGTNNVPAIIADYVRGSDIQIGILIGNELVGTATFIRRQIGISVFVKFAQGARQPQGSISQVEALDMFYLPVYNINLALESIKYNRATNKLEVTLRNTAEQGIYFMGTYTIISSDDTRITVGDETPIFIDGNELKTITYDIENLPEGALSGQAYIIYGESENSLEKVIDQDIGTIESVRILDNCQISIGGLSFNLRRNTFYVDVENAGDVTCYIDAELLDVDVAGDFYIFGFDSIESIEPGDKKQLKIKADPPLIGEDVEENSEVRIRVYYGERENSLVNTIEGTFDLILSKADYLFYTLIVIIILLILLILWKRRKKKNDGPGQNK
ncbi:MAG: hypothetical protein QS98_C0009G0025 [archaeon GW2011_AR3]|nr:MAG: hypothetical protein QS98_C0009G0025 [archaeon GW2011_AR3]MBS3110329.1 hypothetical protein [Candidatus Woesearchaeota archaeon]